MARNRKSFYEDITIDKLVHGGQGLGTLRDGRKALIWNALPNERVKAHCIDRNKDFVEGVATEILLPSNERITPKEDIYLATSPWQNMTLSSEHDAMKRIVEESYKRENLAIPNFVVESDDVSYGYRNKIEFSFYGDDAGLHYAFYNRGTHSKQIVEGSALAMPVINKAAKALLVQLNRINIRAGDLKSIIFRTTQQNKVVGALFTKKNEFSRLDLPVELNGLEVYYSNPRSPASVATKLIYKIGDTSLYDTLLGTRLKYSVIGFFQVNLPVFELALRRINELTNDSEDKIDMYSGVGSIGVPISNTRALIEINASNIAMAKQNIGVKDIKVIEASAEQSLDYIQSNTTLIVDPPRSGLHKDVISRILDVLPKSICYLSCNVSTQARDVALISSYYRITDIDCFNFFPRTPHIETLVMLEKK